jgi:hypothetical protein
VGITFDFEVLNEELDLCHSFGRTDIGGSESVPVGCWSKGFAADSGRAHMARLFLCFQMDDVIIRTKSLSKILD